MTEVDIQLPRKNFDVVIREKFSEGITGIFGPSGSGKTSLLHVLSGLENPDSGKIVINGRTVFDSKRRINIPVHKRNIGYVLQEGRLFPHMTVEENLLYGFKRGSVNKVSFKEVTELLNLGHLLKSKPAQISGGERQRTALGRSILSSPSLLLLDEPFSAVDPRLRNQILIFILRIHQRINIPILVVSHDLTDLLKLTNSLCIIRKGKCAAQGNYYELLKNQSISVIFGSERLVNSIDMIVKKISEDNRQMILGMEGGENKVEIKCRYSAPTVHAEQKVKAFLYADDIALSIQKLTNVTIQNQLQGIIENIKERQSTFLCLLNVGFKLVVEISPESQRNMNLQAGQEVWCLFKSVALDMAG